MMLPKVLERVQRCRYCGREMTVTPSAYAESPFCVRCLPERVERVADRAIEWRLIGDYFYPIHPQRP